MKNDLVNLARGFAMGCADVVPGVSGGTVALITGIYERLVTAVSRVDREFASHLRQGSWRKAAEYLDLRFLVSLAVGIIVGFVAMTLGMNAILQSPNGRPLLLAAFFGMIVASTWLVLKLIRPASREEWGACLTLGLLGSCLTLSLLWLRAPSPESVPEPSLWFLFFCGATAICAMILPGISGAMVLLLYGVYAYLTDVPHLLLHGEELNKCIQIIFVFGCGCAVGLLTFAKVLRALLERYQAPTLATLVGVMIGALPQIWPFQTDLTPEVER